jgi:hypothetical protein
MAAEQTIGGGTIDKPAIGPAPAYGIGGPDMILVKNWDFGTNGTIRNMADMDAEFQYFDQFNNIDIGGQYGSKMLASSAATVRPKYSQPIENPKNPVREILADSLKTYLVPLKGDQTAMPEEYADITVHPEKHNVGNGSFAAKFHLPNGGALLGQDLVFETRVRYKTPPYFWFAIWNVGNLWRGGAEIDLVESFGYDNGGGATNFDGRYFHSAIGGGTRSIEYKSWKNGMKTAGIDSFDATQWHTWTLLYTAGDQFTVYMDNIVVQSGKVAWRRSGKETEPPIDMVFLFDGGWGHTKVKSVNKPMPATEFIGKFYEWDYSRIYLSPKRKPANPATQPADKTQLPGRLDEFQGQK